jgi:hypothetical protein
MTIMSRPIPLDKARSYVDDPQSDQRTTEAQKSAWIEFSQTVSAALSRYETEKEKARSYYLKNRRGYLSGTILRPSLKQLMTVWPTDAQLSEFDEREAGQLAEFEKMVFFAARRYALEERDARLSYWQAVGGSHVG